MITNGFHNWIANMLVSNEGNIYMIVGDGTSGELTTNTIDIFKDSTVVIKRPDNVEFDPKSSKVIVSCQFGTGNGNGRYWNDCGIILDTTGNNNIEGIDYPNNTEGLILLNRLRTDSIYKTNEISLKRTITFEL